MQDRDTNYPPYVPPPIEGDVAKYSAVIKEAEDLAVREGSGITPQQLRNVLDHMFSSEVSHCPDMFATGDGRHNVKIDAGKAVAALDLEVGRMVSGLGLAMCLARRGVIEAIASSRGVEPKGMVDGDIFIKFTFPAPPYDIRGAYEALLNTPFESVLLPR